MPGNLQYSHILLNMTRGFNNESILVRQLQKPTLILNTAATRPEYRYLSLM